MSNYYNPDYPTASMGFAFHTCQPPTGNNDMFYYNGNGAVNPFGNQTFGDSRRDMVGYTPTNPAMGYGYQQPVPAPAPTEQQVMPFSSYPSSTPAPTTPAFNGLVESRRDMNPVVNNNNVPLNPWAQQQQAPVINTNACQCAPAPNAPVFNNPYMNPQFSCGFDGSCMNSLYSNPFNSGFDRKAGCWDNVYTTPRAPMMPNVNWNAPAQMNPMGCQQPVYPTAQYPQTSMSWKEIAERNFGGMPR